MKKLSNCCGCKTYKVSKHYSTTMKTDKGENIPEVDVCLCCGKECGTFNVPEKKDNTTFHYEDDIY